jgi:phosphate:Na+ symporter
MPLSLFEGALGGIGLFLLGMRFMSDGIRTVVNDRIRVILAALTSNRIFSLLLGVLMSLLLNSASAAVIITLGLANGGVITAYQALSILGGVLVGSSLSLHFPGIPYSLVATPLIFAGVLINLFARRRRFANAGNLLLGIGLLFFGLALLEGSFRPFEHHPLYVFLSDRFFSNPFLSYFFGGIVSCLVQSVRSSVSVISALSMSHNLDLAMACAMVSGGFAGIAAMGLLASVAGRFVSRRIALAFMLITLVVSLLLIGIIPGMAHMLTLHGLSLIATNTKPTGQELYIQLTWIHTAASLLIAFVISALSGIVSRNLGSTESPGGNSTAQQPCASYLDARILNTPLLALEQSRKEIIRMMSVASFMYADIREILLDFDARRAGTVRQHEQVLDSLNHEITAFLAALAGSSNSPEISYDIPGLLQTVSDLEHIGDRCEEILERIVAKKEAGVIFSDAAMNDLKRFADVVSSTFSLAGDLVLHGKRPDDSEISTAKNDVRIVFQEIKQTHFNRISTGVCSPRSALFFSELAALFMNIAELCWNVMATQGRKTE